MHAMFSEVETDELLEAEAKLRRLLRRPRGGDAAVRAAVGEVERARRPGSVWSIS